MLADLSIWHILIVVVVLMLVFGSKRIPEMGASIGKGIQEFKRGLRDVSSVDEPPSAPSLKPPPTDGAPKRLSE
jgi:sec-independent protein translocase protein TatA